jgi:hypothetical protein
MWFWLLKPFFRNPRSRESGNVLLVVGMIASAVAVVGGKVMLDSTVQQRKVNQMAENSKRAKEIPGSAAMIAKALISLPPHVANNKPDEWLSGKPYETPENRPFLYPTPYVSGAIGGPAQMAASVASTGNPKAATNWDMTSVTGATTENGQTFSANVNVYTNDSARTSSSDIDTALSSGGQSVVEGGATIKRTKSVVNYRFRNCDSSGRSSATFSGRYCASALITSENHASAVKGIDAETVGANKAMVELGLIEPPPAPEILSIATSDNGPLRDGVPFSLVIRARGVAVGYKVMHTTDPLVTEVSNKSLPLNEPFEENVLTIPNVSGSASSLQAKFNDPCEDSVVITVTLKGIDGRDTTASQEFDIARNLVSCVPGSFSIRRRDDVPDKRTCSIELSKDSGIGSVKEIQLDQVNTTSGVSGSQIFGSPAFDSAGKWSFSSFACSQDRFTFDASLIRQTTCPTPSESRCTPSDVVVPELDPKCDTFSIARTANSMTDCTVTVNREPDSHYGVKVFIKDQEQTGGTWTGDRWEMTNYPCGMGSSTDYTAKLVKGSEESACAVSGSINISEVSWCAGIEILRSGATNCIMKLTKNPAASVASIKTIHRDTTVVTGGTWSGNVYTSPAFACPATTTNYQGFMTGIDDRKSSCGFDAPPDGPPLCGSLTAVRQTPTSTTCNVTMTKGAGSGPVNSAIINGGVISTANQSSYTTTASCPTSGGTITGSLNHSTLGAGPCAPFVVPPVLSCQSLTATRNPCNPTSCTVTLTKTGTSPATATIPSASSITQSGNVYTATNVSCPATGAVITGSLTDASGAAVSCTPVSVPAVGPSSTTTLSGVLANTRWWGGSTGGAAPPRDIFGGQWSGATALQLTSASGKALQRVFPGWGICGDSPVACPNQWRVTFLNGAGGVLGNANLAVNACITVPAGTTRAVVGFVDWENVFWDNEGCNGGSSCNWIQRRTCGGRTTNGCTFNFRLNK